MLTLTLLINTAKITKVSKKKRKKIPKSDAPQT